MTTLLQPNGRASLHTGAQAPADGSAAQVQQLADFSMLGGARIMSSAADAERSARLISWLCALVAGRDPTL